MLVTRSDFARLTGHAPQSVTRWIAEGKLTPPAIAGEGRALRIDVDLAERQLDGVLDITKRGPIDADDKELVRQLRFERVRQARTIANKLERALWDVRTAFLSMINETHREVADAVRAKHPELDGRLLRHALEQTFLDVWRRYHAAKTVMFGTEPG
jgi:hypothetical protein